MSEKIPSDAIENKNPKEKISEVIGQFEVPNNFEQAIKLVIIKNKSEQGLHVEINEAAKTIQLMLVAAGVWTGNLSIDSIRGLINSSALAEADTNTLSVQALAIFSIAMTGLIGGVIHMTEKARNKYNASRGPLADQLKALKQKVNEIANIAKESEDQKEQDRRDTIKKE